MAKTKRSKFFTTSTGLRIKIKPVDPMLLQRVMSGISKPTRPTYETKTFSGRIEERPYDAGVADQTEGGQLIWDDYQERLTESMAEQNELVVRALYLYGTEFTLPDDGWDDDLRFLGIDIPEIPRQKEACYLSFCLSAEDTTGLLKEIMQLTGVSGEAIEEAEATFQRAISDSSGPTGSMVEFESNS